MTPSSQIAVKICCIRPKTEDILLLLAVFGQNEAVFSSSKVQRSILGITFLDKKHKIVFCVCHNLCGCKTLPCLSKIGSSENILISNL